MRILVLEEDCLEVFLIFSFLLVAITALLFEIFADETWSVELVLRDFFRAESFFAGYKEHFFSISFFFIFFYIAPSLVVRRLHDLGRSGWTLINPFKNPLRELDVFLKQGIRSQMNMTYKMI